MGWKITQETYRKDRESYKLDLKVGNSGLQIELFSFPNPPKRVNRPEACGLRHFAFAVADLDRSVAELRAKNIAVAEIRVDELTHKRFTFFADPDGWPWELYEC